MYKGLGSKGLGCNGLGFESALGVPGCELNGLRVPRFGGG